MLENKINGNSEYKSGNCQVRNHKRRKKFERSSLEIEKIIARNILNILYFCKKVSINNLNHFQSSLNLFSQFDHLPIITSVICIKQLLKNAPIPIGTS